MRGRDIITKSFFGDLGRVEGVGERKDGVVIGWE